MADYALALSDAELMRYRMMAMLAAADEGPWWARAGIREGAVVADVGCGPGAVSAVLAGLVGPTGRVHGVDRDPNALEYARRVAGEAGATNVEFSQGTATESGLEPGSFDVVMMRHVLAHNGGKEQAIVDHLASLVKPGGAVYLCDIEASAMRMLPADAVMMEMSDRYWDFQSSLGNDMSIGLRLGELLESAGLVDLEHHGLFNVVKPPPGMRPPAWAAREEMLAAGAVTADEIARWQDEFERFDREEKRPTLFMPTFSAFARKPG